MSWNWQQSGWPNFSWDQALLGKAEAQFLRGGGLLAGIARHLSPLDQEQFIIESASTEALTTSEIEGEILDRASVQSSIRKQLGLKADERRVKPAERGIAEMMVHLYRSFSAPLSDKLLFEWHRMLCSGRADLNDVGKYRTDDEPIQVVSGPLQARKVHFEAPPSAKVAQEMAAFVRWFNRTAPNGDQPLPPLTRAGIAHLYFESIHPFEDGNGRLGRAISEKALAQWAGQATITGLATTILVRRKAYYEALEAANKNLEITKWLAWFAGIAIEAQRRTEARIEFLLDKTRLLDRLRGELNERQQKALLRMFSEGPGGFKGGLSAGNYSTITGAPTATTTRDLTDLVAKGALIRTGERRYARYSVAIPLRTVAAVKIDANGNVS